MKKIDIFVGGVYICSTNQARTCKEAIVKFRARPVHAGLVAPDRLGMVNTVISAGDKVTAHFSKR